MGTAACGEAERALAVVMCGGDGCVGYVDRFRPTARYAAVGITLKTFAEGNGDGFEKGGGGYRCGLARRCVIPDALTPQPECICVVGKKIIDC